MDTKLTLDQSHPEIASSWDYEANFPLTPQDLTAGSGRKVWWKCPIADDHRWQSSITNRTCNATKCPCCCNRKVVPSNCLAITQPNLVASWDFEKNQLKPTEVTAGSTLKVWWRCPNGPDHSWLAQINSRVIQGLGCPFCCSSNAKASSTNNLAAKFPEIAAEWDDCNQLSPHDCTPSSIKKVWWRCKVNPEHRWEATINNRTKGHGCPYCASKKPDSATSVLALHPELCEEWDTEKNAIGPESYLPNSHKKVWWRCKKDHEHRWQSTLGNRVTNASVCPYCQGSGGEVLIRKVLVEMGVTFSQQYRFPDCKHKRALPFDFAIHGERLLLIEFQGGQHYAPVTQFGGQQGYEELMVRDKIKRDYCSSRGIPLLEIHFNDIGKIPTLIQDYIEKTQLGSSIW